ncbi:MAG: TetR family transcriptional regulator [Bacteroidetes bacterium MedPE-SWsnd-G2]|nr:MAG: TetR family transcriptional regulator [Bacteroidetes bacterium MedPE-SWsnd-G2]
MDKILSNFKIAVQESIYNKDPESSELGRRIIENSILLIDKIGFDAFTFKKLGAEIGSNESSIYRYFENKHKLLIYLSSWYWSWIEYQLVIETHSITNPVEKLKKAIETTTKTIKEDSKYTHINEVVLNRIIIEEHSKSFLTKEVDQENQDGYFKIYKRLVTRLKEMILQIDGDYEYATTLASTILKTALHQHFLKDHFPSITDCKEHVSPTQFITDLVFRTLNIT